MIIGQIGIYNDIILRQSPKEMGKGMDYEKEIMTKKDVAEYLGCGHNLVDAIFASPGFPTIKIGRKSVVRKNDFLAYFDYCAANDNHRVPIK